MNPDDMRGPDKSGERERKNPDEAAQLKIAMQKRGWLKVVLLTIAISQILYAAFVCVAQLIDPDIGNAPMLLFSCTTCVLLSSWLRSDARRAYLSAREKGYVPRIDGSLLAVQVPADCPKRWLVLLHVELNPELARS